MKRAIWFVAVAALTFATVAVAADEAPKRPWSDAAELGVVMTTGNSEGTNFALSNKFKYTWSNGELTCDAAALRTESTTRTISNPAPYGTPVVTDTTATTAATYGLAAKYRRGVTERFYWYAGAAWFQNFFAGIDDRYIVGAGVGYTFVKNDRHLFKGEIGADLTREDPLGNPPPIELETQDFVGIRGYLGYEFKFSEKSKLTEDLNVIENLDTTSAWRANSVTALTASFTNSLALVSYAVAYSNEPPVTVVAPDPVPPPPLGASPALYQFETTDTILTVALVVNF
jgi:putative salt-induced outer membrane protein YdiY